MTEKRALQVLGLTLVLSIAAALPGRSEVVSLDFAGLSHTNTRVAPTGDLVIDEVWALDGSGIWYRHPWGYGVWDIQLKKHATTGFVGWEGCLAVAHNPWATQPLHAFNGRLMRAGPAANGGFVATLATGVVLNVPDFAARPACLRFLTYGSHGGWTGYTITLNYATGGPATIVVPIASAGVYPRDGSGAGWLTQGVTDFLSECTGRYGDMVQITNPRPADILTSAVIAYDANLSGPIAVSLSIDETGYEAGYRYWGFAESGSDQLAALRAPAGSVAWAGIDWSATIPDTYSEITVDVYCGEAGSGGSVWWEHAGTFAVDSGAGSADFAQPCSGEFVMCTIDMVAELADSPLLHGLEFRYSSRTGVGDEPRRTRVLLEPGVPNPFRSTTTIHFDLPAAGRARLAIYDVAGRLVRALVEAHLPSGPHTAIWDGRDETGRRMGSGGYFARLEAGGRVATTCIDLAR